MNTIDTIAQNAAREIANLGPVTRSQQNITGIVCAALHLARQTSAPACSCDMTALRDMLRKEFHLADQRDMEVATAVRDWYQAEYLFMAKQPDLGAIIAKVRAAGVAS